MRKFDLISLNMSVAPEILYNQKYDQKIDIWGLGVLFI